MTAPRTREITNVERRSHAKYKNYWQFGLFFVSIALSFFYPGLGFLIYVTFEKYFGVWSKRALVCLIIIQVFQVLSAIATMYFPISSTITPPTLVK